MPGVGGTPAERSPAGGCPLPGAACRGQSAARRRPRSGTAGVSRAARVRCSPAAPATPPQSAAPSSMQVKRGTGRQAAPAPAVSTCPCSQQLPNPGPQRTCASTTARRSWQKEAFQSAVSCSTSCGEYTARCFTQSARQAVAAERSQHCAASSTHSAASSAASLAAGRRQVTRGRGGETAAGVRHSRHMAHLGRTQGWT